MRAALERRPWLAASPLSLLPDLFSFPSTWRRTAASAQAVDAVNGSTPANTSATEHAVHGGRGPWIQDLTLGRAQQAFTVVQFGINVNRYASRHFMGRTRTQFQQALNAGFPGACACVRG